MSESNYSFRESHFVLVGRCGGSRSVNKLNKGTAALQAQAIQAVQYEFRSGRAVLPLFYPQATFGTIVQLRDRFNRRI